MNSARLQERLQERLLATVLLAPCVLTLTVFVLYPALYSVYLSFHEYNAFLTREIFVGLENYRLLLSSGEYWQSVGVSLSFLLLTAVPSVVLSLFVALLLNAGPWLRGFFRIAFITPIALSSAMAAMLWIFLFNPTSGYLNFVIEKFGVPGPNWLGSTEWALVAVSFTTVWREIGFNVVFFLAALASVPDELYEAAQIDGAGWWRQQVSITLPLISPTLGFVSIVTMLNAFQSFGQIHILTAGGPAGSTNTLVYNLYRDAFQNFQTGSAAAQSILLFGATLLASWVQLRTFRRKT